MKNLLIASIWFGMSALGLASDPKNSAGFAKAQESAHEILSVEKTNYSGVVDETMNSGGYTYVKVRTKTESIWAATREGNVKKGDYIILENAFPMHDFQSKTLKRTFDVIYFASDFKLSSKHPKM
jgi:hypothetical protein